ncbi:unnamed protein product [Fasciola hepatica]|uniref:Uncharacterized protein n=1 Tax=Fasciola hepatica TaxID=6192 RepID=A0ABC9HEV3_FASHE
MVVSATNSPVGPYKFALARIFKEQEATETRPSFTKWTDFYWRVDELPQPDSGREVSCVLPKVCPATDSISRWLQGTEGQAGPSQVLTAFPGEFLIIWDGAASSTYSKDVGRVKSLRPLGADRLLLLRLPPESNSFGFHSGDATHTKGPVPEASWATALALVYFETALDTRASEWKLLARKANGWSMKQVTVGISDANSAKEYCDALTAEAKNFW